MSELVEFLLREIAADEEAARAATPGPWRYDPSKMNAVDHEESVFTGPAGRGAICVASTGPCDDVGAVADAAHIARHDPARVLADCEALRAVMVLHQSTAHPIRGWVNCATCGARPEPCPTMLALAQPFAGRPGWRDEWALDGRESREAGS